jgi:hypothetical protein
VVIDRLRPIGHVIPTLFLPGDRDWRKMSDGANLPISPMKTRSFGHLWLKRALLVGALHRAVMRPTFGIREQSRDDGDTL